MTSMALLDDFSQLETELKLLWPVISSLPPRTQTDFRCFANAVQDWRLVSRRYDRECLEYRAVVEELFQPTLTTAGRTHLYENKEAEDRFLLLHDELAVDIRSFYIFAEIAYRTALALIKRLSRKRSRDLFRQFDARFHSEREWFEAHVSFYRSSFVEHPKLARSLQR